MPNDGSDAHLFHATSLRAYDIRGVVGEALTAADAYALGRAFAVKLRQAGGRRVAVGYDGRESSPKLEAALVRGFVASGIDVTRIGLCATPTLYFAVHALDVDGGVMVTGSHNPPEYNGFKMMLGRRAFYGEEIQELARIAAAGAFVDGEGRISDASVVEAHIARIVADNPIRRPLKVVWDPAHGAPACALPELTARLPGEHVLINCEVDSAFPAHHPDPTQAENLVQLQEEVRRRRADLGIAFDGDGDRIGVVDGEGEIVWADQLLVLLARDVLKDRPGATIIADVKASQILFDAVAAAGGAPLMWRTGRSLINAKMTETDAPLAGEMSGHIFCADRYYGFDDALYVAARTLSILSATDRSLADFRKALPKAFNTPELRFACPEDRKFQVVAEVSARLKRTGAEVCAVDGARVKLGDGWWLLRASNTQNALVARCEAMTASGLAAAKAALVDQLRLSGVEIAAI